MRLVPAYHLISSGTRAPSPADQITCLSGWQTTPAMFAGGEKHRRRSSPHRATQPTSRMSGENWPTRASGSKGSGMMWRRGCITTGSATMTRKLGDLFTRILLDYWVESTFTNMLPIQFHGLILQA